MATSLARDDAGLSTLGAFVALVLVIALVLGVYYVYIVPGGLETVVRAQEGDDVDVQYIGIFADTGYLFDTSEASVALDNASFPKAASFSWRARWDPLSFTIGDGKMIRGFDSGVRGLAAGESKTIVVSPKDGYGVMDPSLVVVRPLLEPVPVRLVMDPVTFNATYGVPAVSGTNVTDPIWGWAATVSVAENVVTVTNSPLPGDDIRPYDAWDAEVASIDSTADQGRGVILVRHQLLASMVDRIQAQERGQTFYLSTFDEAEGTFTVNFNRQVVGRTLIFQVTMGAILRI